MGLDMYLEKHTYVGNTYKDKAEQVKIVAEGIKQERITSIVERIGYWRKANAIHYWFVQHTQDGVDDNGQDTWVHKEKLQELLDTVNKVLDSTTLVKGKVHGKVLKDTTVAQKLLPTVEGFYFGGTDYDEGYWQDLLDTKKILETAIAEEGDYYYQSSW